MPELPEVETVRRGLVPKLVGRRTVRLIQRRRDLRVPLPAKFAHRVEGRTVLAIERRAKYLLLRLDDGNTLIAQKDVTVPTGTTFAWSFMDSDSGSDGNGLLVSADGNSYLATGRVATGDTATDNVVVVNGTRMGAAVTHGTLTVPGNVSSLGEDGEGELYMASMNSNAIYKIEAAP